MNESFPLPLRRRPPCFFVIFHFALQFAMNTTEKFIQSTCKAILHSCSELQRANDALQERVIALTRLSALRADMVQMADNERVEGIESRLKMESEVLALRQRVADENQLHGNVCVKRGGQA